MPSLTPFWPWCPQPGMARATQLTVDSNNFGDGYVHRATRGLNPARPSWQMQFPFTNLDHLAEMDNFLVVNAACGFWIQPPDAPAPVFVYCDAWSASLVDKSLDDGIVGTLQASFTRCFNPQPITAS